VQDNADVSVRGAQITDEGSARGLQPDAKTEDSRPPSPRAN
jgi:hypothetical protein